MRKKGMWWIILAGIVVIAGAFWRSIVSNVEHPKYKIVASYRSIEIRDYGAMIVAEVEVAGERDTGWFLGRCGAITAQALSLSQKYPLIIASVMRLHAENLICRSCSIA